MCLRVLPVKVRSRDTNKTVETYALLDNRSDVSCDKNLASELGVQGDTKTFFLTTREKEDSPKVGQEISLTLEALDDTDRVEVNRLWTVDKLNASSRSIPSKYDVRKWPHLHNTDPPSISEREVKLIIGSNAQEAFWVLDKRRGKRGEPYAIRSPLGWTLVGPMDRVESKECHHNVNFVRFAENPKEDDDRLMQQLEKFWKIENCRVIPDSSVSMSVEDKKALAIMKIVDGHYEIALPWRQQCPQLPNNRCIAERRLYGLKKRSQQDNDLFENYKATMESYLDKKHARRVLDDELIVDDKPLWCLPHHPVLISQARQE